MKIKDMFIAYHKAVNELEQNLEKDKSEVSKIMSAQFEVENFLIDLNIEVEIPEKVEKAVNLIMSN